MSADRDTTRIVRSWLRTDEHESADRILDDVLGRLDTTRQRRSWWPAWRIADMNNIAKLLIAAAAVVVVAVVGINLLPGTGGVGGGPAASPSPSPQASPSPQPSPSPSAAAAFPSPGPLEIGTYPAGLGGAPVSFTVSTSGWRIGDGGSLDRGPENEYEQPDHAGIRFWATTPDNVYADPCAHTPLTPRPAASAAGLAAAVVKMPGIDVVAQPTDVTIDGRPGQYVAFRIREDIGCDPHDFWLWYEEVAGGDNWVYATALGSLHRVWIVDVDGKPVWIDSETFKGAKPEVDQEVQQIVESIKFE